MTSRLSIRVELEGDAVREFAKDRTGQRAPILFREPRIGDVIVTMYDHPNAGIAFMVIPDPAWQTVTDVARGALEVVDRSTGGLASRADQLRVEVLAR